MTAPAGALADQRERLLAAVRTRLDAVGGPAGNGGLHTAEARAETDALLRYLVAPDPAAKGGYTVDPEVAYALGVAHLLRADDRPEAPAAAQDLRYGLVLLGPFYCNLPGQPDLLPPALRAGLDGILGPNGKPADPGELVHEHAATLANAAMILLEAGVTHRYPPAIGVAADLTREALPRLRPQGPDRALARCNLGYALLLSAIPGPACPETLAESVSVLRAAFADTPREHPNHARCANGLGLALLASAGPAEDRGLLSEAVDLLRTATRTATDIDRNVAQMHSDLGYALTVHARTAPEGEAAGPEVREEAVAALRRSLDLTPAEDREALRDRLGRLADAVLIGLPPNDRPRAAALAGQAAEVLRRLLDLTPDGHPERPDVLLRLAADLVVAQQPHEVMDLLTAEGGAFAGDAQRVQRAEALLMEAALLQGELQSRADLTPEQREDERAIGDMMRSMLSGQGLGALLKLIGMGPADGAGGSRDRERMEFGELILRYPDEVSMGDLYAKAVGLDIRRIAELPEEERGPALAEWLEGRGADRPAAPPEEPVDTSELDEVLVVHERLLPTLPENSREHHLLSAGRNSLRLLKIMHGSTNASQDTEEWLRPMRESRPLLRETLESMPARMREMGLDPELLGGYAALASAYESPFEQLENIEARVRGARQRLAGLLPGTPEYDETRAMLAMMLFPRYTMWNQEADFEEAAAIARELTAVPDPGRRTAMLVSAWASAVGSRTQRARLVGVAPPQDDQSPNLMVRLASKNTANALDDRDPVDALETLEHGRARLLSRAINARREFEVLHGADAEQHARLRAAMERIRTLHRSTEPGHWPTDEKAGVLRAAYQDAARLVTELQQRPGFHRFLTPLPLGLDDLLPAAAEGPVVSINVNPRRCDALALGPGGVTAVPLPRLDASDLAAQAESFRLAVEVLTGGRHDPLYAHAEEVFTGTLAWLWDVLAEPVLDALGYTGPPEPGAPWPRLWWSPSGVLNSFPLHAAGHHGEGGPVGAAVLDRVASSYTPTLRALLFSRARRRAAPGRRRTLAVAVPYTAGQLPLARTVAEAEEAVAAGGGVRLIGPAATRDAVRAAVPDAAVVHFACHADSDPEDPSAGRLLLSDGDLLIRDIAELRLDAAELAYLSACGTARGTAVPALDDGVIHLASVFQLAGYAQSVATLWEVEDSFAADAAARFHRALAPSLANPGPLPAGLVLHDTVRFLRESYRDRPWSWAALVHAGA